MGHRWPLPNIIRSTSRFPAQPAAYPLTGRHTCTDHRADGLLICVLDEGGRDVVVGGLQQRTWTAEDGSARSTVEVVAEELGPSLRWTTATPARVTKSNSA
jgi:hypothetical protein